METNSKYSLDKRAILGIVLTIIGFLLLADNLGWMDHHLSHIIFSWPMLLILIGLLNIFKKNHTGFGIILITIGVYFIVPKIPYLDIPSNYDSLFWAFILVALGIVFIFRSKKETHFCSGTEKFSSDYIDEVNVFGGGEKKLTTNSFRGGKITSVFGGSNYDLLECKLADGKNVLDMVNVFGGSKIIVPNDWKIHVEVVSIFGGFSDKRRMINLSNIDNSKELYITGVAIFGGGEIKNF
jgi:predicted membrane protein